MSDPQLPPAVLVGRSGAPKRDVLYSGRVIGNIAITEGGYDGETEHGVHVTAARARPFTTEQAAADAVVAMWVDAEEGPVA